MYILGIAPFAFSSAALLKDGKLIAAAAEERFTRIKFQSMWPKNAINYVLKEAGINLQDVDYFALPNLAPLKFYLRQIKKIYLNGVFRHFGARINFSVISKIPKRFVDDFQAANIRRMGFNYKKEQIFHIEHHIAHSSAAFRCSPFKKSLIMSIDGHGDSVTTMLSIGKDNKMEIHKRIDLPNSLGRFYDAFTEYLGYRMGGGHEEKIMGLAAYGKPNKDFRAIISLRGRFYKVNPKYTLSYKRVANLEKKFGPANISLEKDVKKINQYYIDIAATLQKKLEEAGLKLLKYMRDKFDIDSVCLGGGTALNVKMNGEMIRSGLIKDFYAQPAANDSGNSLGAAMETYARLGKKSRFFVDHCYWGPGFDNDEIKKMLTQYKLPHAYYKDIAGVCAKLLAQGKILGWFQGRMEWGPRALGNRSILMDPTKKENKDKINFHVKFRENWRPFCPSILEEAQDEYLENSHWSPFMNIGFNVKPEKIREIPAVIHVDNTTRPQTVQKKVNPLYWKLIKEFERHTGVPVLLNTSFNIKGEPIVCTPRDAISCFFATGMDYLAIGNFLVKK